MSTSRDDFVFLASPTLLVGKVRVHMRSDMHGYETVVIVHRAVEDVWRPEEALTFVPSGNLLGTAIWSPVRDGIRVIRSPALAYTSS